MQPPDFLVEHTASKAVFEYGQRHEPKEITGRQVSGELLFVVASLALYGSEKVFLLLFAVSEIRPEDVKEFARSKLDSLKRLKRKPDVPKPAQDLRSPEEPPETR